MTVRQIVMRVLAATCERLENAIGSREGLQPKVGQGIHDPALHRLRVELGAVCVARDAITVALDNAEVEEVYRPGDLKVGMLSEWLPPESLALVLSGERTFYLRILGDPSGSVDADLLPEDCHFCGEELVIHLDDT